ncbi:hypothetical protein TNCV_3520991 [Trichonephila clavipes]|nr:hypothetical protein TNCV_3520991 [Trichonephila clavipes]
MRKRCKQLLIKHLVSPHIVSDHPFKVLSSRQMSHGKPEDEKRRKLEKDTRRVLCQIYLVVEQLAAGNGG